MTEQENWDALRIELDAWADEKKTATMWLRDDDAVTVTPALEDLARITGPSNTPVALAVIPREADATLQTFTETFPQFDVLQHGLAHTNHAPSDQKKSELGAYRPASEVIHDLTEGARLMKEKFSEPRPVLVPPWNRIADDISQQLPGIGITGLSTFQPRAQSIPGLVVNNTHVDVIDWRANRDFAGLHRSLAQLCQHLRARRAGSVDPVEATGILTHHLVHTPDCWQFLADVIRLTGRHPAVRWLNAQEIFDKNATG